MKQVLYKAGGREKVWGHNMHIRKFDIANVEDAIRDGWSLNPQAVINSLKVGSSNIAGAVGAGSGDIVADLSTPNAGSDAVGRDGEKLSALQSQIDGLEDEKIDLQSQLQSVIDEVKVHAATIDEKNAVIDERNEQIEQLLAEIESLKLSSSSDQADKPDADEAQKVEDEPGKKQARGRTK